LSCEHCHGGEIIAAGADYCVYPHESQKAAAVRVRGLICSE
jgi:hypothetical protein